MSLATSTPFGNNPWPRKGRFMTDDLVRVAIAFKALPKGCL
jgi:hypothetical protein